MKTRKKVLALLLAACCMGTFTACGEAKTETAEPEQKTEAVQTETSEAPETEAAEEGITYKTPSVEAAEWETKTLDDLAATDLSSETIAYQLSGTSLNAQGKAFGLMMNLYEDGLVVTTQLTKGSPAVITYYGYWEKTEDPSIDVTQFGCILTNMPESMASLNDTQYGADKNCNTYNQFVITDGVLGGSVNFSVAPMQYGATNSMTISQEGEEIKYDSIDQFKEEIEAMEETYESGETATESSTEE